MKKKPHQPIHRLNSHDFSSVIHLLPGSVYWKDLEGRYLGCNEYMLEMVGMTDVVGKTDYDLCWRARAAELQAIDRRVVETDTVLEVEEEGLLADGRYITVLTRKAPLKDASGKIFGVLGVSLDITERKQLESELKGKTIELVALNHALLAAKERAEVTLDSIVADMPGHVYWKNQQGVYLGCNNRQARSLGFQHGSEVIGKTDFDLPWEAGVAEKFRENDEKVMKTGQTLIIEEKAQIDGREATVLSQKSVLRDKQGNIVGVLGISIDITDRKKIEISLKEAKERAEAANKAKTEFLENMRHDIRTPLVGITGFANLIKEEVTDLKVKEHVDHLVTSSYALLELLNEILEVIKVGSGDIPLAKKKFNLKQRLHSIVELNLARAAQQGVALRFEYDDNLSPYVVGDPVRLHRIALELVSNALNFTHQGHVSLKLALMKSEAHDMVVKLVVEDTGIGMPPEKKEEIFLQFKRLTPSYEGIYKGAGLGLTIVKQFIDDLEGEIYVESQVGVGSTFICLFPLKKPLLDDDSGVEPEAQAVIPALTMKETPAKNAALLSNDVRERAVRRILLVEDHALAARVVESTLSQLKCHVDWANCGQDAVQLAQKYRYDLIFMDIGLPDFDGYEVTKRIRMFELKRGIHVPIVALTAHVDDESKQRCIEVGMNAVLTKPLTKEKANEVLKTFSTMQKAKEGDTPQILPTLEPLKGAVVDYEHAKQFLGDHQDLVNELLEMFVQSLPEELKNLETAYSAKNWGALKDAAHKIKGGTNYCGTLRLKEACSQMEAVIKSQKSEFYEAMYIQLINEMKAIEGAIRKT